jgi:outer membrane lipoprotein-sorting protein
MNKYILVVCLAIFNVLAVSAQEQMKPMQDVDGFKSKLIGMAGSISTISSDFIQEKNLVVLSEKITSKGSFFYKKENNIRWEYTTPFKYLIIIKDGKMYTGSESNSKVNDTQSNKMFQEMTKFMGGFINGDILKNEKDFTAEYFEGKGKYYVKLVPRSEKTRQMLEEIDIWFDSADLSVSGIKMIEPGDDYTKIDFINKKLNSSIPLEKFAF